MHPAVAHVADNDEDDKRVLNARAAAASRQDKQRAMLVCRRRIQLQDCGVSKKRPDSVFELPRLLLMPAEAPVQAPRTMLRRRSAIILHPAWFCRHTGGAVGPCHPA